MKDEWRRGRRKTLMYDTAKASCTYEGMMENEEYPKTSNKSVDM